MSFPICSAVCFSFKMATKHALKDLVRYYVVTENLFTFQAHLLVLYSTAFHREWGDFSVDCPPKFITAL